LVIFDGGPLAAKEIGCAEQDNSPSFEGQRANSIATPGHQDLLPTCIRRVQRGVGQSLGRATATTNPRHVRNVQLDHRREEFLGPLTNVELSDFIAPNSFRCAIQLDRNDGAIFAPLSER
jgi:hypothetical protein